MSVIPTVPDSLQSNIPMSNTEKIRIENILIGGRFDSWTTIGHGSAKGEAPMKLEGERVINASNQEVWESLNNTEVLKACIPGCSEFSGSVDEGFTAKVTQKIGPVRATFNSVITVDEIDAPNSYRICGEGKGGAAGFAKGSARVQLATHEDGTTLTYKVDAKIGGKLAQLGSRLVGGVARKLSDQFFATFQDEVEARRS